LSRREGILLRLLVAGAALGAAACRQDMHDQPKLRGLRGSEFFADGRSARPEVADTVSRTGLDADEHFFAGTIDGRLAEVFPFAVTRSDVMRGQERFDIFCSPCHGRVGDGRGMVVRRGLSAPPSFHLDRLRSAPPGYFFGVITHGFGKMQDYAAQVPPRDRWDIVAYLRALQLSQNAGIGDVPAAERARLEETTP
jgi:mono/diheme cytochrome c family protein